MFHGMTASADESPLNRLQQRSGEARWDELRSKASATAPLPAALSPEAPGSSLYNSARTGASAGGEPATRRDEKPAVVESELFQLGATPAIDAQAFEEPALPIESPFVPPRDMPSDHGPESFQRPTPSDTVFLQSEQLVAPESSANLPPINPLSAKPFVLRPITHIQPFFDYSPTGEDPCEHLCPVPGGLCPNDPNQLCPQPLPMPMHGSAERFFPHLEYYWTASNISHNPLYFENPALERYGHVHFNDCIEPAYSMARFGVQFVGLPYQMALDAPWRREYALGWYRPGDFAPKLIYQPPLNARAAGAAAAVYTGLFFLVP